MKTFEEIALECCEEASEYAEVNDIAIACMRAYRELYTAEIRKVVQEVRRVSPGLQEIDYRLRELETLGDSKEKKNL